MELYYTTVVSQLDGLVIHTYEVDLVKEAEALADLYLDLTDQSNQNTDYAVVIPLPSYFKQLSLDPKEKLYTPEPFVPEES